MSLPFKKVAREDLSKLSVYVDDTSPTSTKYFRVSDVPEVLQKGKNLLRISAHPTNLVEGSQILIDVRDSNGNPIYFEIPDYLEEDKSRAISIWIYHDKGDDNTANGEATITLVGTSNVGNNGESVPQRFKGNPNVRWQTTVNVDRGRKNTSSVLFKAKQTPTIQISESIESYRNQPQSGNELLSVSQTGAAASYIYKGETPIVQLTDGTTFNNEMINASIVLSSYGTPATPVSKYDNPLSDTFFSSSISKLINSTTAVLLNEYTTSFDNRDELTHTYRKIESANYSIQYVRSGSNVVTENERSFANITLSNVDPIAGVVDKVKVLIKSDGLPGEFELLNEVTVPYSASFSVKVPVPSENLKDPKLLKIQYLNSVGEISRTETITNPFVFQGGNSYIGGDKNLISGSMFISNALGTGIEMGGVSSGFIRSVGFDGQTSASLGKGPGGFIIYSGSGNMLIGEDVLHGVGMQMIGDNDARHFIFTTDDGGNLDIKTDKFFIGNLNQQYISGSDSNIEISSSLFHLDPKNNSLVIGAGTVINAALSANQIFTPATIGGVQSTALNASASIDSSGFAKFVSASIGGFEVSTTQINSANNNLILKDSGQITGSTVLFSGGKVAGFEISNSQINSVNDNLILKASGQITASDGFLFGNKASSQYVQYDDGNLVVRGDLSVDQIFTPATIAGSPANITNASSSITSDGFAKFTSASIGGWDITTSSIEGGNLLMKPEGILQTKDFASGLKGWKISSEGNGTAEFENVRIRGTMRTTTFEKESVNAVGGQLWIANSSTLTGSILATAATMSVKNIKGFVSGEILLAKKVDNTGFQTEYILVNSSSLEGDQSNEDENYGRLYVTRGYGSGSSGDYVGDIGSISQSYEDGQVVVSTGKIGTGYIKLNANPSDQATPFMDIVERTGSGLYDVALAARLGDLSGLAGSSYVFGSPSPGYGLATNNVYLQGGIKATFGDIGGFGISTNTLSSSNNNLILKDSGQITGSTVLFSGGTVGGFELTDTKLNSVNDLLILSSSGQLFAESGRIASFIITSSNFDALRLVEEFTPTVGTTATFIASEFGDGSTPSIPTEVDNRATITITNVTSSNIAVSERTNATTLQLGTATFSEKEDYEIEYSGSFTFNSGEATFVSESILTKFVTGSYGAVSGGFYALAKPEGEFSTNSSDDFLTGVTGLYAFAIEAKSPIKWESADNDATAENLFLGSELTSNALSLDQRVEFYPANNSDLEFFIKPDLTMLSTLTGSSVVISSSNALEVNGLDIAQIESSGEFSFVNLFSGGEPNADSFSNPSRTNAAVGNEFINTFWTASAIGGLDYYLWVDSSSLSGDYYEGGDNQIITYYLTASFAAINELPDAIFKPNNVSIPSGPLSVSNLNTLSSSFFLFDQDAAVRLGYGTALEMQNARQAGAGSEKASFLTQSYAPLRGVTSSPVDWSSHVNGGSGPSVNLNYGTPGGTAVSDYYAAYLEPGWSLHPTVETIINNIDTNPGAYNNQYPNSWAEIAISGSTHHSTFVPDANDTTPSHGVPLTLYNNFVRTEYTPSTEVKLYNSIWPLDIAESGSFQPSDGTQFGDTVISVIGSAVNITNRLDSTRVQTDLTPSQLASLTGSFDPYEETANDNTQPGPRYEHSVTHESTKQFSEGRVSTGTQSGSFVEKITFTISGSGELSSSNFFLDDRGDITGSKVNFSGGTISGSALNISANRFEFKNKSGRIFGNPNNFIISSSLLSLDNNNLQVKGDIRASTGFIQETFLGGKIVETGVRHPSVANLTYQLPFIEAWATSSTDRRLDITGSDSSDKLAGSHGNWRLGGFIKSQTQYLVTGSTFDGVGYPDEFKSWYGISNLTTDYKFIDDTDVLNVSDASASLSPTLVGTQLVFNSASFTQTGSSVPETITSEFINISSSLSGNYRNTHLQFAARGTTHPYTDGFTGFFPQYQVDIISGSTTYFSKKYKDENATHRTWKVFDIPITDILTTGATNNTDTSVAKEFKVKLSMNYSGSSSTGTLGTDVTASGGIGWALTEMRMVEPVRAVSIDTQTLHFKDTYLTWDGKLSTAHKGNFVPISTSSNSALSESIYTLGTADKRWKTAYLKDAVSTLSDRRLKSNIEISDLGLSFIDSLKPVKYNMNDDTTHYGLIAQEVSQSLSEFDVHSFGGYDDDGSYLSLRYSEFISPMIKAIQDQQQIIKTLQNRIEILESGSNN
jgi:hypothetical protein